MTKATDKADEAGRLDAERKTATLKAETARTAPMGMRHLAGEDVTVGRAFTDQPAFELPDENQIVLAQVKNGPLVVAQYRTDPEHRRLQRVRAVDAETHDARRDRPLPEGRIDPHGPLIRGDFFAPHAGGSEYSVLQAPVVAWAPLPQAEHMTRVPSDEEIADWRRERDVREVREDREVRVA